MLGAVDGVWCVLPYLVAAAVLWWLVRVMRAHPRREGVPGWGGLAGGEGHGTLHRPGPDVVLLAGGARWVLPAPPPPLDQARRLRRHEDQEDPSTDGRGRWVDSWVFLDERHRLVLVGAHTGNDVDLHGLVEAAESRTSRLTPWSTAPRLGLVFPAVPALAAAASASCEGGGSAAAVLALVAAGLLVLALAPTAWRWRSSTHRLTPWRTGVDDPRHDPGVKARLDGLPLVDLLVLAARREGHSSIESSEAVPLVLRGLTRPFSSVSVFLHLLVAGLGVLVAVVIRHPVFTVVVTVVLAADTLVYVARVVAAGQASRRLRARVPSRWRSVSVGSLERGPELWLLDEERAVWRVAVADVLPSLVDVDVRGDLEPWATIRVDFEGDEVRVRGPLVPVVLVDHQLARRQVTTGLLRAGTAP